MSLAEALTNTAVGFGIGCVANAIVLPLFGFYPTLGQLAGMSALFTVIAIARSYILRRIFERFVSR